jgi:hypothetical protein
MPSFRLAEFKPMTKNTLKGFVRGVLDCGDGLVLEISDITIHRRDGREWIGWPTQPLIDRDGNAVRDAATGKVKYSAPLVRPADRDVAARIEAAILEAVRCAHPDALGDGEAGEHGR